VTPALARQGIFLPSGLWHQGEQAESGWLKMKIAKRDEIEILLAGIRPREPFGARNQALLRLALATGLRSCELCGLDIGDVWMQRPRSWLVVRSVIAKGGHSRSVPLNSRAQMAISDIIKFNQKHGFSVAPEAPLLVTRQHTRLPTRTLRDLMQRYRERVGLDQQISPHVLRHTVASRLANNQANIRVVQEILGHKRLATTEVYLHTTPEELSEAMELLD
jgi:site-specific recombinase XerD